MKKQFTTILLVFALLLTLAGCSAASAAQKQAEPAGEPAEITLEVPATKQEEAPQKAEPTAPAAVPTVAPTEPPAAVPAPTQAPTVPAEAPRMLTEEQAQQIALEHLGVTADQVSRIRVQLDYDDGVPEFDVEFRQGDWDYEYEIHAETGRILSFDKDHKYD